MKTKKITAALLAAALALSLAACGGAPQSGAGSSSASSSASSSSSASQPDSAPAKETVLFGQVQEIVGNEVTILLAKEPEAEDAPESDADGKVSMDIVGTVPAMEMTPAIEGGEVPPAQEIEYTGETVTVTLPAGLKITNAGQEATLSALSKGSLVTLGVDGKDTLNPTFLNILA